MSEEVKKEQIELTTGQKLTAKISGYAANLGVSVLCGAATGLLMTGLKGHKVLSTLATIGGLGLSFKLGDDADKAMQQNVEDIFKAIEGVKLLAKKMTEAKNNKEPVQTEGEVT